MNFSNIDNEEKNKIAKEIEYNVAQEAMARDYYYELKNKVADEHKHIIDEIIEDEINHSLILMRLCEVYTGNKPTEFQNLLTLREKNNE